MVVCAARLAGTPVDEILLSSGMPRTLYGNNAVPLQTHIVRSQGSPIFSLTGFTFSLLCKRMSPEKSLSRDLANASLFGHLAPLPTIDGGTILKWKLVEAGQSPKQADQSVRKISLGLGETFLGMGTLLGLIRKGKLVGGLLAAGGAVGIAAGIGWLK